MKTLLITDARRSQAMVMYAVFMGVLIMFLAFMIDFGMMYISKSRLQRAIDGSALAGVQCSALGASNAAACIKALVMSNDPNMTNLASVNATVTTNTLTDLTTGLPYTVNTYGYTNSVPKLSGIRIDITVGSRGYVTAAKVAASSTHQTIFLPAAGGVTSAQIGGSATAQKRPRMISIVLDRSGSMLLNGGATNLPGSVTNFLNKFETAADLISISTFSYTARLDMQMTTNFINLGSNAMLTNTTTGLVFDGATDSAEGLRMGYEQLFSDSSAWNDPNTLKYLVFFTDGVFNMYRTLAYSPGFTNIVFGPPTATGTATSQSIPTGQSANWNSSSFIGGYCSNALVNPSGTAAASYKTNLSVVIYPGTVGYIISTPSMVAGDYTAAKLTGGWWFTNNTNYSVVKTFFSQQTNSYTTNVTLQPLQHLIYYYPGYTNLDILIGQSQDVLIPSICFTNKINSSNTASSSGFYPPVVLSRVDTSSGYTGGGNGKLQTNLLSWTPGVSSNDFTNGWAYFTSNSVSSFYTNQRNTNMVGTLFTQGMTQFTNNKIVWQNGTRYWNPGSSSYVGTTGINTNNSGSLTNVIMVYHTNNTTSTPVTNLASFVWVPSGASSSNLYINPYGYSGYPTRVLDPLKTTAATQVWDLISNIDNSSSTVVNRGNSSASNVCYYARMSNITVFTVGFGAADPVILKALANDASSASYDNSQPTGSFYQISTPSDMTSKFQAIADRIRAVLSE